MKPDFSHMPILSVDERKEIIEQVYANEYATFGPNGRYELEIRHDRFLNEIWVVNDLNSDFTPNNSDRMENVNAHAVLSGFTLAKRIEAVNHSELEFHEAIERLNANLRELGMSIDEPVSFQVDSIMVTLSPKD